MMTQNVKTQVINFFSDTNTGKSSAVKSKSSDNDFGSVMDSNLKSKSSTVKDSSNRDQKAVDNTKSSDVKQKDDKDTKAVIEDPDTKVQDKNAETGNTQQADNTGDENLDLTGSFQKIEDLLEMLQNTVKSSLGITKEELEKAMETLGLSALDLFNPDNLKQLVLQVNGTEDISKVLTDENLSSTLNQLIQAVDDLQSGQNDPISQEELTDFMNQFPKADLTDTQPVQLNTVPEIKTQDLNSTSVNQQSDITIETFKTGDAKTKENDTNTTDSNSKEADVKTPSPVDVFIQNLAVKGTETNLSFTEQIANVRQMQNITDQIVEQIKIIIKPEQTSMELQLNPESLGKINLSVVAKDGIMTAHFTAQNELAKEAIESQIQVLRDNLNNQGLKVESIEVTVSNFSFDQSNQAAGDNGKGNPNHSQNRNINAADEDIYSNSSETQDQGNGLMDQSGGNIDYTA